MGDPSRRPADEHPLSHIQTTAHPGGAPSVRWDLTEPGPPGSDARPSRQPPNESGRFAVERRPCAGDPYGHLLVEMAENVLRDGSAPLAASFLRRFAPAQILDAFESADQRATLVSLLDPDGRTSAQAARIDPDEAAAIVRRRQRDWTLPAAELLRYFPAPAWIPRLPQRHVWRFLRDLWRNAQGASQEPAGFLFAMLGQHVSPTNAEDLIGHGLDLDGIAGRIRALKRPDGERAKLHDLVLESRAAPGRLKPALLGISPHLLELFPAAPALDRGVMDPFARAFGWEQTERDGT